MAHEDALDNVLRVSIPIYDVQYAHYTLPGRSLCRLVKM